MAVDMTPNPSVLPKTPGVTINGKQIHQNGQLNGESNIKDSESSAAEPAAMQENTAATMGSISSSQTIYKVKVNDKEHTWTNKEPADALDPAENDETAKYAVILRSQKSQDSRKKFEAHSIVIQSPWLRKALAEILEDYPGVSCELERLVFEAPFKPFMHRWSDLQAYLERDLDETTRSHLNVLNEILQLELRDDIKAFKDYLSNGITTFEHAWMLFQPGGLIVSDSLGPMSAYELVDAAYRTTRAGCKFLTLECHVIEWSGSEFGRHTQQLNIPEFRGTDKITNLAAFPMLFHPDKEDIQKLLVERGRKFEALAGYHFKSYTGVAITWDREGNEVPLYHDGRIVVDCKAFNRYSHYRARDTKEFNEKDRRQLTDKERKNTSKNPLKQAPLDNESSAYVLSDYFRLLCNCRVRGYSLPLKKWLDFFVPTIQEIKWNTRAFDSLVLPEDQKELVLAFTESQVQNRQGFDDMIQGKGQGIIILLSGKPGIGKTLTAESVAEAMRRPLHTISSGDLGQNAWDIEYKLMRILEIVGRWNAVLLLDECDVFLEARSTHDLTRNAMVSTFLRTLEYYTGILFLTTNRADNIDPAFESRIHVSLQYPDLTPDSRRQIWSNFLSTQDHALDGNDLNELAKIDLNGRQIKNILKTSHLLSSQKKQKLCMKDISTVLAIENRRPERKPEWH